MQRDSLIERLGRFFRPAATRLRDTSGAIASHALRDRGQPRCRNCGGAHAYGEIRCPTCGRKTVQLFNFR